MDGSEIWALKLLWRTNRINYSALVVGVASWKLSKLRCGLWGDVEDTLKYILLILRKHLLKWVLCHIHAS